VSVEELPSGYRAGVAARSTDTTVELDPFSVDDAR
jgi:hypothetical protein